MAHSVPFAQRERSQALDDADRERVKQVIENLKAVKGQTPAIRAAISELESCV